MSEPQEKREEKYGRQEDTFPRRIYRSWELFPQVVPAHTAVYRFVDSLTDLMFPVRSERLCTLESIEEAWEDLQSDFHKLIAPLCPSQDLAEARAGEFFSALPSIHRGLLEDAGMYRQCDPASGCIEEVVLCYPGFYAVMVYRIAHVLHRLELPILPRVVAEYAHRRTGIDIHPGAEIGPHFYIDHGTGVVIGQTTVIGQNVCIYQGVTLGASFVDKELRGVRRHPTIQDNVIIYAGSTILGGDTVIGHDTVIGGNVWLTESVPPHSRVYHRGEVRVKVKKNEGEE